MLVRSVPLEGGACEEVDTGALGTLLTLLDGSTPTPGARASRAKRWNMRRRLEVAIRLLADACASFDQHCAQVQLLHQPLSPAVRSRG